MLVMTECKKENQETMKAFAYTDYGSPDVLKLVEVDKPTPKDNEVLIKVQAASLNIADYYLLKGNPFLVRLMEGGLTKPKKTILGADVAGQVEAVGKGVTQFKVGDAVFGDLSVCGWGGLAEYVCARDDVLVYKPHNLSFEQAAAVPMAAVTALQGVRDKGKVKAGAKVLINGATGGVGSFTVQLAKAFGAVVTAVCSTRNVEMVRSIGADHVIDYTQQDFTQNGERYDVIIAANGYHPLLHYVRSLTRNGTYIVTGGTMPQIFQGMLLGPLVALISRMTGQGNKTIGNLMANSDQQDLTFVSTLLENGKVVPVIDQCFPFSEIPNAFRYLGKGHARGKVVISVASGSSMVTR
jgi:NADPH:quinone reductase-like Zn-dependent oxidoreductase